VVFKNRWFIFAHDLAWVPLSVVLTYLISWNFAIPPQVSFDRGVLLALVALPVHTATFTVFGCYRGIWRYASIPDLIRLVGAVISGALLVSLIMHPLADVDPIPAARLVLYPMILLFGTGGSRVLYRYLLEVAARADNREARRTLIVGAGRAGEMLVRDIARAGAPFEVVGLVDDDYAKQGYELQGVRVIGRVPDLKTLIDRREVKVVLVAMPSAPRGVMEMVVQACADRGVECRTLPSLLELADGQIEVSRLRAVTIEDLLGRDPVELDRSAIGAFLRGRTVLVTGGGGSIGSELCRQVLAHEPERLVIVELSEFNLYEIERELSGRFPRTKIKPVLGDVKNAAKMDRVFEAYKPQVVFHAAAYKHVPMIEFNPVEGILNNVRGTRAVADLAVKHGVAAFILVSTDKTVNPTNVMGATKRVAEIYCQSFKGRVGTRFVTTRFGNVLGSAGSVVPLFNEQIAKGGPVTVTHQDITRYFMTIPEASGLILQAGAMGHGGEIFVLDMGKPVRIVDLARRMIQLSGYQPEIDIAIKITGLRPGEKMHEELFYEKEPLLGTQHPKLLLAASIPFEQHKLEAEIQAMLDAADAGDAMRAVDCLKELIPEFKSNVIASEREEMVRSSPNLRVVK